MRKQFLLIIVLCLSRTLYAQPVISSFAPTSGPSGSTVYISGVNFSSIPAENIVFFGAIKALVISSTSTLLEVLVPTGASFQPLSVTTNNLTGYSTDRFVTSFEGNMIDNLSFSLPVNYQCDQQPQGILNCDLDNDGRSDIIISNRYSSSSIALFQNTSTIMDISFRQLGTFLPASGPYNISFGDIDGDGRPEIISANYGSNTVTVYKNLSTPGNIIMSTGTEFTVGLGPTSVAVNDIDGDGKPDIVCSNYATQVISVLRNVSAVGNLAFEPKIDLTSLVHTFSIKMDDLNNDGKPEIIVTNYNSGKISIWPNISTAGSISFDTRLDIPVTTIALISLATGDFDADGKLDIVAVCDLSYHVYVLRNTSMGAAISFANTVSYINTDNDGISQVAIADMNGDTKPDIVLASYISSKVLRNQSSPGSISFGPETDYIAGDPLEHFATSLTIGDFNNDGKADIATCFNSNNYLGYVSVFTNRINAAICTGALAGFAAHINGTSYQWQMNDGNGYVDISDNVFFSGASTDSLILMQTPSSFSGHTFRCKVITAIGPLYSQEYYLRFTAIWTGNADNAWENPANWNCGVIPDSNTDVIINNGIVNINVNSTIRSLSLYPGATFNVTPGVNLVILH